MKRGLALISILLWFALSGCSTDPAGTGTGGTGGDGDGDSDVDSDADSDSDSDSDSDGDSTTNPDVSGSSIIAGSCQIAKVRKATRGGDAITQIF